MVQWLGLGASTASGKEFACQFRSHKRGGFDAWVREIPWRRAWQPTPVFLLGESHGQRSLVGYSPQGRRVGHEGCVLACTHSELRSGKPRGQKKKKRRTRRSEGQVLLLETEQTPWGNPLKQAQWLSVGTLTLVQPGGWQARERSWENRLAHSLWQKGPGGSPDIQYRDAYARKTYMEERLQEPELQDRQGAVPLPGLPMGVWVCLWSVADQYVGSWTLTGPLSVNPEALSNPNTLKKKQNQKQIHLLKASCSMVKKGVFKNDLIKHFPDNSVVKKIHLAMQEKGVWFLNWEDP